MATGAQIAEKKNPEEHMIDLTDGGEIRLRVAIADDDQMFRKEAAEAIEKIFLDLGCVVQIDLFISGRGLQAKLEEKNSYHIYLLDIEMPGVDGMHLAQQIRNTDKDAYILFITSHEKYAIEGYRHRIYRYVMKSQWKQTLPKVLQEIVEEIKEHANQYYYINTERYYKRIHVNDIKYIKKEQGGKNVIICCIDGKEYEQRISLREVYQTLSGWGFVCVNRTTVVNLKYLEEEFGGRMKLTGGVEVKISERCLGDVRKRIVDYWGRRKIR